MLGSSLCSGACPLSGAARLLLLSAGCCAVSAAALRAARVGGMDPAWLSQTSGKPHLQGSHATCIELSSVGLAESLAGARFESASVGMHMCMC